MADNVYVKHLTKINLNETELQILNIIRQVEKKVVSRLYIKDGEYPKCQMMY